MTLLSSLSLSLSFHFQIVSIDFLSCYCGYYQLIFCSSSLLLLLLLLSTIIIIIIIIITVIEVFILLAGKCQSYSKLNIIIIKNSVSPSTSLHSSFNVWSKSRSKLHCSTHHQQPTGRHTHTHR